WLASFHCHRSLLNFVFVRHNFCFYIFRRFKVLSKESLCMSMHAHAQHVKQQRTNTKRTKQNKKTKKNKKNKKYQPNLLNQTLPTYLPTSLSHCSQGHCT